jgi:hypothetical protein
MLLVRPKDGYPNIFEGVIKSAMENSNTHVSVFIHQYDLHSCLLSDRGFSQPRSDGTHMAFSFNLCANAFVDYVFTNLDTFVAGRLPEQSLNRIKEFQRARLHVTPLKNRMDTLTRYNRRVIEQCHRRVYCSTKSIWLG